MNDHRDVELRHLRYFVTVAEEGTMREAARVLRIAQPSLSQQISTLERRVGAPLFHGRPKGMELTEGGADPGREAAVPWPRSSRRWCRRATRAAPSRWGSAVPLRSTC